MTGTTRILTARQVQRLMDWPTAIRVSRAAFLATARGEAVMPAKLYLPRPRQSDFRAMPASLSRPAAVGIKWVNVHPDNRRRGLPTVMALIVMNDPSTGRPLAVLDGLVVTKLRTAAAAAVAAQVLARGDSRVVALVGCGAQADAQAEALCHVLPVSRVRVWGLGRGEAERFCRRMRRRRPRVTWVPVASVAQCVREANVVVTLTPSRRPIVRRAWLAPGTHINAVGADAPGKQELAPEILREAIVVVDDRAQALHGGEINVAVRRGQFRPRQIRATLGELLTGRVALRRRPGALTVFDSTGLAVHDVAMGASIVRRAQRRGVGRCVDFFDAVT